MLDQLLNGGLGGLDPTNPGGNGQNGSSQGNGSTQAQPALGLITLGDLPDGYQQARSSAHTSQDGGSDAGTHEIVVSGPKGNVAIVATRGPDASSAYDKLKGDAADVAGTTGKAIGNGVAWMADDDLLVVINADKGVPHDDVLAIADAVQVQ